MMPMVTYMSTTVRAKEAVTMPVLISTPPAITTKRWPKRLLRTVDSGAGWVGEEESRGQHPSQQLHQLPSPSEALLVPLPMS